MYFLVFSVAYEWPQYYLRSKEVRQAFRLLSSRTSQIECGSPAILWFCHLLCCSSVLISCLRLLTSLVATLWSFFSTRFGGSIIYSTLLINLLQNCQGLFTCSSVHQPFLCQNFNEFLLERWKLLSYAILRLLLRHGQARTASRCAACACETFSWFFIRIFFCLESSFRYTEAIAHVIGICTLATLNWCIATTKNCSHERQVSVAMANSAPATLDHTATEH